MRGEVLRETRIEKDALSDGVFCRGFAFISGWKIWGFTGVATRQQTQRDCASYLGEEREVVLVLSTYSIGRFIELPLIPSGAKAPVSFFLHAALKRRSSTTALRHG